MSFRPSRPAAARHWALAFLLLITGFAHAAAAASWTIQPLGAFGDRGSIAFAVNNRGDVAGYSAVNIPGDTFYFHAFLWQNGVMQDIGAGLGAQVFSQVLGMNDSGTLVGGGPDGAMMWKNGTWTELGFDGGARAINNAGTVVGTLSTGLGTQLAVMWRDGVVTDLGGLGGRFSSAAAINSSGLVAGQAFLPGNLTHHAFAWRNGAFTDLGTFGGASSTAVDVNDRGEILGHAQDADGQWAAFIATESGAMRRLMAYPDPHFASAINQHGEVVGTTQFNSYLYADGTMTILEQIPEVQAAGWFMLFPMDINDRGWITGWGWRWDGPVDGEGFLLIPKGS